MKRKIGHRPRKAGLYPNIFSAIINRCLAKCREKGINGDPYDYKEYAQQVTKRFNHMYCK